MQSLPTCYRALILGASGAIGAAIASQLEADPRCAAVAALSRSSSPAVDFGAMDSISVAADSLRQQGSWHLIVIATGMLSGPTGAPEKRLADLNAAHMAAMFFHQHHRPGLGLGTLLKVASKERARRACGSVGQGWQYRRQPSWWLV